MKYINMDDLTTIIQNRLLIESIEKEEEILAGIEDLVISEVCAYIGGRYDVGKIFGDPPIRTGLLVRVVACITACRAVSRNATRKVPDSLSGLNDLGGRHTCQTARRDHDLATGYSPGNG